MPNLLLLCEFPTLSGGERSMLSTIAGVQAAGFRVTVAAPQAGPLSHALAEAGIEHVCFPTNELEVNRPSQAERRADLACLLRRVRPDLLHANSLAMSRLSGPVAAEAGIPSIGHLRDIVRLSQQAIGDLNRHRRLLAVSHAVREYHIDAGLDGAKAHVVYNGIDLTRFRPRQPTGYLHRELALPPDACLIGTIGQICLRKGQDVLTAAATGLAERFPAVHYLIVGRRHSQKQESAEFEASLFRASKQGPLAGRLHLLGERHDVDRILNELAILVHPARQEPLGRVLLEAAASGTAVVATAVGGTAEIFPAGAEAARLVAADSAVVLGEAIAELLNDTDRRLALGKAARARAVSTFDVRQATASLVAQYKALVSSDRKSG